MTVDLYRVTEALEGSEYRTYLDTTEHRKVLGAIFNTWMPRMYAMPVDAIKDNIITSINLAMETIEWKKNATLSTRCRNILDYLSKGKYTKRSLMTVVCNTILSSDGLGLKV